MYNSTLIATNTFLEFSWIEYTIFSLMLGSSVIISIYYGFFGSKQASTSEYLLGSRKMGVFPTGMSLVASSLSGITLLGLPAEIYMFGAQYWLCVFGIVILALSMIFIYLPVLHNLRLNNLFEYLELRYDSRMKNLSTIILILNSILYAPIVIYIPALAFKQVSGINVHYVTPIICGICVFYTTIGGLKGVIWSDTFQFLVTMMALMVIFFFGLESADGFENVMAKAGQTRRLDLDWDLDPTSRTTFWGITIGYTTMMFTFYGLSPFTVQRYLAVPTLSSARITAMIFYLGLAITKSIAVFLGLILVAKYHDCDPLTSGKIDKVDQIFPYFVMELSQSLTGLAGIFVAGITTTALSTMSTILNTTAGQIYEDFVQPMSKRDSLEKTKNNIIKLIVILIGLLTFGMIFVVENLGGVMSLQMAINGFATGPMLSLYTMGIFLPYVNSDGAFYGYILSGSILAWIGIGQQVYSANGVIPTIFKPLNVEGCENYNHLEINNSTSIQQVDESLYIYRISFYWYSLIGFVLTFVSASIISYFTKHRKNNKLNRNLFSPLVHRFLPKENLKDLEYSPVECNDGLKMESDRE